MADYAKTPAEVSEDFDPYYVWLGIPPQERPINHYRLLGLSVFESNPEVIAAAADRQMGFLRTHQLGRYQRQSQILLNEVANAKVCLLNPFKKAEYDQQLRRAVVPSTPAALPADEPSTMATPFSVTPVALPRRVATRKRDKMTWPTSLTICGLAIGLLVAAASVVRVRSPDRVVGARPGKPGKAESPVAFEEPARRLRVAGSGGVSAPLATDRNVNSSAGRGVTARSEEVAEMWAYLPGIRDGKKPATAAKAVPKTEDQPPLESPSDPPLNPVKRGFELTVKHDLLWGWSRRGPRAASFEPIRYDDLLTVTLDGMQLEDGFFEIDGKAVRPEVTCTKWIQTDRAVVRRPPEIRCNGRAYDVAFGCAGDYVFHARVGNWQAIAKIEVRQIPAEKGMPASRWIAAMGVPDHKDGDRWQYKKLPGIQLLVAGDPGRLRGFVLVDHDAPK